MAVVVVVSAPHRGEAFDACRYGIDTLKATVPIWKHESWNDGSGWGSDAQQIRPVGERVGAGTTIVLIVIVLVVVARHRDRAVVYMLGRGNRPRRDDGVASFQRHLDALSPEARRQVIDRVKKDER